MECLYCYGQCSCPYAYDSKNTRRGFCSKPCLQAYEAERLKKLLVIRDEYMKEANSGNPDFQQSDMKELTRFYKTQMVLIRALLKGTKTQKLDQLKTLLMERCVDMIEISSEIDDNCYKTMSDDTKELIDNFDYWIKVFGN